MPSNGSQLGRKTQLLRPTCDPSFLRWNQYVSLLVAFWGVLFLVCWKISPHCMHCLLLIIFIVSDLGRSCCPRLLCHLQPATAVVTCHRHCPPPPSHAAASGGGGSATRGDATTTSRGKREGCAAMRGNMISSRRIKRQWRVKMQGRNERSRDNQPGQSRGELEAHREVAAWQHDGERWRWRCYSQHDNQSTH